MMKNVTTNPKVYAVKHQSETVRAASRSGGIFTALSDLVLKDGGIVYGCVLTNNYQAVHIKADNDELRNRMRGSKYIQSELGDAYKNVKYDLEVGRDVLFSGTSCQVAGLRSFLEKDYEGLFCIDIVCHGVPSKNIWMKYLKWQELRSGKMIVDVDFRNKNKFGWRAHRETLTMDDGSSVNSDIFTTLFYSHYIIRPCCYECPYKNVYHPGDVTIADYWGIEKAAPEFDDNKGVSLVLVNTDKGKILFEKCKKTVIWKETKIEDSMQEPLKAPFPCPDNRETFWDDFHNLDFEKVARRYGGMGCFNVLKKKVKRLKSRTIRIIRG